jgi:hypothetical protein
MSDTIGPGLLIAALAALAVGGWNDAQGALLTSVALLGVVMGCLGSLRPEPEPLEAAEPAPRQRR